MTRLDIDRTRRLVAETAATLIVGLSERATGTGTATVFALGVFGPSHQEQVVGLAGKSGVAIDVVERLVARIAPVVASAIGEVRAELGLSDDELTVRLRHEHHALADLGLVDPPAGDELGIERLATETRNVARVRVPAQPATPPDAPRPGSGWGLNGLRTWIWWTAAVVASMIVIAVLLAPRGVP